MSIPSVVGALSFTELTANNKAQIRVALEEQLDIPCQLDYGLYCSDNELRKLELPNMNVYFDPASTFVPADFGVNVVLQEELVTVYSAKQPMLSFDYGQSGEPTNWPTEWAVVDIDTESDAFWNTFFLGLDNLIEEHRALWLPISLISSLFVFIIILLTEILIDTLILSLFRFGRMKFSETFKIVLNAMTLYVLIGVILELYGISINNLVSTVFQMIPLVYTLIAIRNPIKR